MSERCTCPKRSNDQGAVQTVFLDVFCPVHGRPPSTGCAGCDALRAELKAVREQMARAQGKEVAGHGQG